MSLIWEVTIKELTYKNKEMYKVTRRMPELGIAETRIYHSKEDALELFKEWVK